MKITKSFLNSDDLIYYWEFLPLKSITIVKDCQVYSITNVLPKSGDENICQLLNLLRISFFQKCWPERLMWVLRVEKHQFVVDCGQPVVDQNFLPFSTPPDSKSKKEQDLKACRFERIFSWQNNYFASLIWFVWTIAVKTAALEFLFWRTGDEKTARRCYRILWTKMKSKTKCFELDFY